jgi:hypothetical protein
LLGVRPRRIVKRHQADQIGGAVFGAARHRQRPVSFQGGVGDAALQRLDRSRREAASLCDGPHGALHHAQPLPILFDHGFRPPGFRIERRERDPRDRKQLIEDAPVSRRSQEGQIDRVLVGLL